MRLIQLLAPGCLALALACSRQSQPVTQASGEHPAYAEHYPARLTELRSRFAKDEARVRAALPELPAATQKLEKSDPATLAELLELASAEGKSSAFASQALEAETVTRFWDEERQQLHQKIAGAVVYAGKQKSCAKECSDDLGGVAAFASDRAVDKQLEERQQRLGEIHRFVEDHEEQLTKAHADTAEKQANVIARLSHLTYVRLELYRRELEASLDEAGAVRTTLDRTQRESDAVLADPKTPKARRAVAEKRKASAFAARAAVDTEVEQGQKALDDMALRQNKLAADYEKAFDALIDGLEAKAAK